VSRSHPCTVLYVDEDAGNLLEPLNSLKHLSEIKLLACNFYADKVDQLLQNKGQQLSLLHMEHIDELDMNALCCVAENCPGLKRLVFFSCDFVENFGSSLTDKKFEHKPFEQLESLVCVSESAPNIIEFLLVNACNLKSVQFGSTAWFNDDTVAKVLTKGALKHVEEIRILRSYELTMRAVNALLEACPKLHILAEMDGWEGIGQLELIELRKKIKDENLDLDTFIAWSVTG
jgi:ribonuclease P/MRP protein subunit RPP40